MPFAQRILGNMRLALSVCALFISVSAFAQEITVTGKVVDEGDGSGLPGVNVQVGETGTGTITDIEGQFTLTCDQNATLSFSYIGYVSQSVTVGSRTTFDIQMAPDVQQLAEVVVIGYGSVEKKDVTGVVASVDEEQFNKGIIGSPDKLLTGKVAGLQISSSGDPGAATEIRLRGPSINGESPLFVVDGIPLDKDDQTVGSRNPLNFLNPSDVENITVLKDASAAAIYGTRGANGVILITTKNGEQGKMKISYDGFYSVSKFNGDFGVLSPENFRLAIFDKAPAELADLGDANTNWVDEVMQVAQGMQHNVAVSGGGKTNNYFASVNYLDNQGVLRNTSNKTTTLSLKLSQKMLNNSLRIDVNSKNGFIKDQYAPDVIGDAMKFDPTRPVRDANNTLYGGYYQWNQPLAVNNPVSNQDLNDQEGKTFRSLNQIALDYKLPFLEGLSFKTNLGYNYTKGEYYSEADSLNKSRVNNNTGIGVNDEEETKTTKLLESYLNYKTALGVANTTLDVTAGYSWQNFRQDQNKASYENVIFNDGNAISADTLAVPPVIVENRLISFFGRAIVSINGKYIVTASLRRDGSTKFGDSNKWGLFPSVAVAWRVLEEDFASNWNIFSDFKIRAGYGVTGNQDIPSYRYSTFYKYGQADASYQFGNQYYLTLRPAGVDPNLQWEETISSNIGVDLGLFGGRLNMSAEYYIKDVHDLLYEVAVPAGSNLSDQVFTNIGEVRNQGFELTLDGVVIDQADFTWNLGVNMATNKNEVRKLDNTKFDPAFGGYNVGDISGDVGQRIQVHKVGEPINSFKTYIHKRNADGTLVSSGTNLDMYEDQLTVDTDGDGVFDAGDGIINEQDLVVGESPNPDFIFGLTSNMKYKNFDLSFTFRGSLGNYVYNNVASSTGYFERLTENSVTNNIHESAYITNFRTRQLHSDYYVEDASFVKLDNISLGYSFSNLSFARIRAYVTAQNVFTITKYSGTDPEVFSGIDNNLYPRSSTFIVGVNANF